MTAVELIIASFVGDLIMAYAINPLEDRMRNKGKKNRNVRVENIDHH